MEARPVVFYEFSRRKVERGDFSDFLGHYGLDRLPTGRRLRQMMDSMAFFIQGYDDDPREIYAIPEIRQFYKKFREAWPYWFYFCNLDQDGLKVMSWSCIDRLADFRTEDKPGQVVTEPAKMEFVDFLAANLGTMNAICERAEMFDALVYDRSKAVFEYFGLPYEAERPETCNCNNHPACAVASATKAGQGRAMDFQL